MRCVSAGWAPGSLSRRGEAPRAASSPLPLRTGPSAQGGSRRSSELLFPDGRAPGGRGGGARRGAGGHVVSQPGAGRGAGGHVGSPSGAGRGRARYLARGRPWGATAAAQAPAASPAAARAVSGCRPRPSAAAAERGETLGQSQPGEPGRHGALPDVVVVRKAEINPRAGRVIQTPRFAVFRAGEGRAVGSEGGACEEELGPGPADFSAAARLPSPF
ncbi:hypothetical protein J1605_019468 [Eschrichtius robustus]|uniref:Uncharacterized protein n=1 Tax=Eschrichtius robustus TaxID=9764 RepID=A0AB34HMY3_ESCRO|nr:hypothetical protein J1605_019468 [Eschrichtius robustus]